MLLLMMLQIAGPPAGGSTASAADPRPLVKLVPAPAAPRLAVPGRSYAQVLAAVRSEFPRYDSRAQGRLGPLEFGTWVMRANGAAVQPPGARRGTPGIRPVTAMNATARAFAKADLNHDGGITPDEMATFLTK